MEERRGGLMKLLASNMEVNSTNDDIDVGERHAWGTSKVNGLWNAVAQVERCWTGATNTRWICS